MNYYALIYYLEDDYLSRRPAFREKHLGLAEAAKERGELILGGALGDPPDRALLVFRGSDVTVVEQFAERDPYVKNGLVIRWEVQPWTVVIGN